MRRIYTWLRSHPLVGSLLALVVIFFGHHFFAEWRAEVRWQRYASDARARGVKLELSDFAPPDIPDSENFAALPMFRPNSTGAVPPVMEMPWASFGDPLKGERINWPLWRQNFKAMGWITDTSDSAPRDVLRALEHFAPECKQWREWRSRPRSRFPLETDPSPYNRISHLGIFQSASKFFSLRIRAQLALRDSKAAYQEYIDGMQAYRALAEEPTLIAGLIRITTLHIILSAVGEGLRDGGWDEMELKQIEDDLANVNIWADLRLALASEQASSNTIYNQFINTPPWKRGAFIQTISGGRPLSKAEEMIWLLPTRQFRDNQLRTNFQCEELIARISADNKIYNPDLPSPSSYENLTRISDQFYFCIFRTTASYPAGLLTRFVVAQTLIDQTRIAIALARFRAAHGNYPEALQQLVPQFISAVPVDTYTRQRFIYRPIVDGTY